MSNPTQDLEETDLVLHTRLCAQRYEEITNKFVVVEERLGRIEQSLTDIKTAINHNTNNNLSTYLRWAGTIIVLLIGTVGTLLVQFVLK